MKQLKAPLRITKNTSVLFLGTVGRMVISFGFVFFVARYLGVGGFGKFALTQRYFDLFLGLSATGLSILITREVARRPERTNAYFSASIVQVFVLTVLAAFIMGGLGFFFDYAPDTRLAIVVAAAALFPAAIAQIIEAIFVAYETAEYVTYGTLIESVLRSVLGVLFLWMGYGLMALFVALFMARVTVLIVYFVILNRNQDIRWEFDRGFLVELVRAWRVFALENWISNIYANLGIILLSFFHSEQTVGLYAAAGKLLRLGSVVAKSYTTAIYPYLARTFVDSKEGFRRVSLGSMRFMVAIVLPVVLTIFMLADPIVRLVFGDEFQAAVPILQVLVWVLLLNFFNPYLSHILFAREDQRHSLGVAAVKLVVYLAMAFWLIPTGGGIGAAQARLISASIAFATYFLAVFQGQNPLRILWVMARATPPTVVLVIFFLLLPEVHPIPLVAMGGILYIISLFVLGVISRQEVAALIRLKS